MPGCISGFGNYWAGILPEGGIEGGIPFNAQSERDVDTLCFTYGVFKLMQEAYAANNMYYAAMYDSGETTLQSTFPMDTPDSFKGKKVRASGYDGEIIKLLGGSPVTVAYAETYMAYKLGTVDSCMVTNKELELMKLKEVTKYFLTNPLKHYIITAFFNMDALNKLPADVKDMITKYTQPILMNSTLQQASVGDYILGRATVDYGIKLNTWSETDVAKVRKASIDTIWPKLAAMSPRNAKLIDAHKKFMQDFGRL